MMKIHLLLLPLLLSTKLFSQENVPPPPKPPVMEQPLVFIDEDPEFPGGHQALQKFMKENIQLPAYFVAQKMEGKCYLKFVITKTGTVEQIKVVRGVTDCPECDQEAIRVVKLMPKWKPGRHQSVPVDMYFNLPIRFKAD